MEKSPAWRVVFFVTRGEDPELCEKRGSPDTVFLVLVLLMLVCGAVMSFSASSVYGQQFYGDSTYFFKRYVIFAVLSVALTVPFVLFAKPAFFRAFAVFLYVASLFLLILVLLIGTVGGGAQRWLVLGPITIQPSEVAKLGLVLMLALVLSKYEDKVTSVKKHGGSIRYGVLLPGALIGTVCLLVAAEKHISGLLIIGMLGVGVMFLGGTRLRYLAFMAVAVAAAGCLLVLVSSYAQVRVDTWLHIEEVDPLGSAWQTLQGLYAIGSGGLFGLGLGEGRQKHGYVSQPQNDFIFTVICEELGFFGALFILTLFVLLVLRGFRIAAHAPDRFSSLVVYGISLKLALQTILNVAVVTNSMPNTGVSLPFFSSGGTFLAMQIFEMGIVLAISRYGTQKR
ncbi:MAG: FtsW/RodA/SpoVE family cell cycle protein [Clostridia bacterium]|nr:FtsW/RodA/SpoVE family cell cycle protein [Clostridia bacterium]